jgi:aspartyl-tRNA(Asn)/glutamyl-tRNA(Gln) amidotransferase subunit C
MAKKKKRAIGKKEVEHVASLARLTLTQRELKKFQKQLSEILDYVAALEGVETAKVKPTSQVTGLENVFCQDKVVEPTISSREALSSAPQTYKGFFKIKGILGK